MHTPHLFTLLHLHLHELHFVKGLLGTVETLLPQHRLLFGQHESGLHLLTVVLGLEIDVGFNVDVLLVNVHLLLRQRSVQYIHQQRVQYMLHHRIPLG